MKASDIDKKFDDGEDITRYLDMSKARRPGQEKSPANSSGKPLTDTEPEK